MNSEIHGFGEVARKLARNPLGIIALFIMLVYGFSSMVTIFSESLTVSERMPLIYFLILFPVLVLIAFLWLVTKHNEKLYAPSDFNDEQNYMRLQSAFSLGAATAKTQNSASDVTVNDAVNVVRGVDPPRPKSGEKWKNQILWVDDHPGNNIYERQAFEAMGLRFTLAESTNEAFEELDRSKYAAIISDMGRREGPREGYMLLDRLRAKADQTPLFFYATSNAPEHKKETRDHGGQGCTNNPPELFEMVVRAVVERQSE